MTTNCLKDIYVYSYGKSTFLYNCMIDPWNNLPDYFVTVGCINDFKNTMDVDNHAQRPWHNMVAIATLSINKYDNKGNYHLSAPCIPYKELFIYMFYIHSYTTHKFNTIKLVTSFTNSI